jgi:hypothetical protein
MFWRRSFWKTPKGFFTPFGVRGDSAMDQPGAREAAYAQVFSTLQGRNVLADILALAGVGRADFEPGMPREDASFYSGMKAGALEIARRAGLDTGALGRALVTGQLEAMTHGETDEDADE